MKKQYMKQLIFVVSMLCAPHIAGNGCCTGPAFPSAPCRTECGECPSNNGCDNDCGSHSFFRPREITPNNVFEHNLSLYWWYHEVLSDENCNWWSIQVSPFYQRSTNNKKTAQFFLPDNSCNVSVKEDGTGDVGSLWLNLISANDTSFSSAFTIAPRRSVAGAYFNFRFDLSQVMCNTWLAVAFAAMRVKHELNLCETQSTAPGVACDLTNTAEALNQPDWFYGRFNNHSLTRHGVDDVQFRFGYDWFYCDTDNHLSPYIVGTAGTGNASHAEYIFEPMLGSNHGSIGAGVIGEYAWDCCGHELTVLGDLKYRYVLSACERRSFDLCKNGDWSRYLLVVQQSTPANSLPGINVFTQDVRVTPGSTVDLWLALHYQHCNWNAELGYDFWWRQRERVQLCNFPCNFGIYDMVGSCNFNPTTASGAKISQSVTGENVPASDPTFVTLTCNDLNLNSGATPSALSNTIYAAASYDGCLCEHPSLIGIGGSYEFGRNGDALSNWAVWAKFALAF